MSDRKRYLVDRRRVLGAIGAGAAVGVAGCLGGGGDDEDGENGADGDDADDGDDGDGGDAEQTFEPTEFPDDEECAVCNMTAAEYPDWNAQLVHENEDRAYFCTSGCMSTYYAVPDEFDAPDSEIAGVWATDFETRELVDGTEAYYVLETDPDRIDDPMMRNPAPFADRDDAVAYVDEYDDLTEDDIVRIEDFDRDTAEMYRERFLGDDGNGDGEA